MRNTFGVHIIIPDPQLAQLIGTSHMIARVWPAAAADVMTLVHVFFVSTSLAQALSLRLFVLVPQDVGVYPASLVVVALGMVLVTALALDSDNEYISEPQARLSEVRGLQLIDVAVGGSSALQVAG